jgi:hypothetical protein
LHRTKAVRQLDRSLTDHLPAMPDSR